MYELFADPEVDIVLNITRPNEHYEVTKAALLAGKHVYSEKPLAAEFELGVELVKLAQEKGLMLGGAPDTFLGAGLQTCRRLIDDGYIGIPIGCLARMISRGPESWHPDPEFFYKPGGGPMMDMGPYYITALINMLGGVKSVCGMTNMSYPERIFTCKEHYGEKTKVETPTSIAGVLEFKSGAMGTIYTTFDVSYNSGAALEIYGSEGTLFCPDPNNFGGEVKLLRRGQTEAKVLPHLYKYSENSRGLGLADMAKALQTGRDFRASYVQTLHVLEILTSIQKCGAVREYIDIKSKYTRPAPMKWSELDGVIE
jgi:predicted dehydrogenase